MRTVPNCSSSHPSLRIDPPPPAAIRAAPPPPAPAVFNNPDGWVVFDAAPYVRMRVFQVKHGKEVDSRQDFEAEGEGAAYMYNTTTTL